MGLEQVLAQTIASEAGRPGSALLCLYDRYSLCCKGLVLQPLRTGIDDSSGCNSGESCCVVSSTNLHQIRLPIRPSFNQQGVTTDPCATVS